MYPRTQIVQMFSTFVNLEAGKFSKWLGDRKLYKSMQNCLNRSPQIPREENFWALYWHKQWLLKSNNLARMHILAYLQEPCYHVSRRTVSLLQNSPYSIADYFQMANAEVETILKDFDSQKSSNLKAYFAMAIKSRLKDILRQRKEADICSKWALLRKVSKKLFLEAHDNAGLSAKQASQYRLAWTCFKQLYVQTQSGGTASLPEPTAQLWQKIANLYNDSRHQLAENTPFCTAKTIESWLNQSVIYLRAYQFPAVKSLDITIDDDDSPTLDLPDPASDSILADLIAAENLQEQQNQISQMFGVLSTAFQTLDTKSQIILRLYYQEQLTQQKIMQQLQMSQPTISRKLVKGREFLLEALVKWSLDLNISVTPNQIKDMSVALEEWLINQLGNFNMNL